MVTLDVRDALVSLELWSTHHNDLRGVREIIGHRCQEQNFVHFGNRLCWNYTPSPYRLYPTGPTDQTDKSNVTFLANVTVSAHKIRLINDFVTF